IHPSCRTKSGCWRMRERFWWSRGSPEGGRPLVVVIELGTFRLRERRRRRDLARSPGELYSTVTPLIPFDLFKVSGTARALRKLPDRGCVQGTRTPEAFQKLAGG